MRSKAKAASAGPTQRNVRRARPAGVVLAMLACLALFAAIGAPAAGAAPTAQPGYGYLTSFGSGELDPDGASRVRNLVAVDSHGNVIAADESQGELKVFAPDATVGGTLLTSQNLGTDGVYPADLAIDLSDDDLYVGGPYIGAVKRYVSDGLPTPTYTLDPSFEVPLGEGIAVDSSSGDLLVADPGAEGVHRYDTTGALVETINTPGLFPQRIAVAPDGSIYAAQEGNPNVLHFSGTGTLLNEVQNVGDVTALAVQPASGALVTAAKYVAGETSIHLPIIKTRIRAYSSAGEFLSEAPVAANATSLAIDGASGRLYAFTGGAGASGPIDVYIPATYPGVEAPALTSLSAHSVHLSAEVDPGVDPGGSPGDPPPAGSEAHFEYSADGGKTWKSLGGGGPLSGPATIQADLTGLLAHFDYQVRAVASNSLTKHTTDAVSLSTSEIAPEVVTGNATDVNETNAVLNGNVNPSGLQTTYHYEYGTTTDYGSRVPVGIDAVAGNDRDVRIFSRTIVGLQPGTTYHYRIVATNAIGTSNGVDRTFTTTAAGAIPQRGYEQVTPIDKQGKPLDPNLGFQVSDDGSALAYVNRNGKVASPQYSFEISRRGAEDWESGIDLSVPLNVTSDFPNQIVGGTTLGISPDFTHQLVATNRKLTPDAIEGGTNLYRVDIDSRTYELVGSFEFSGGLPEFIAVQTFNKYTAGAPDFSWIVFKSVVPLVENAPFGALYRWSEDKGLEVVSVLPNGEQVEAIRTSSADMPRREVSADGSRIYFDVASGSEVGVFLHEVGKPTKAVSVSHVPGDPATPKGARILSASKDGRFLFFYVMGGEGKLTSDAPGSGGDTADVYRYDSSDDSLEYLGAQTDSSPGASQPTLSASPLVGVSDDGSTVYFRGPDTANGVTAPPKTTVWRNGAVATVVPSRLRGPSGALSISPSGRYFVYQEGSLLGDEPIYLYDADAGTTDCVSCLPDGSAGPGVLPLNESFVSHQRPRAITDAGQVFFTSSARLVAADVNGTSDAYMFQNGKPSLISPGNGPFLAKFADVSADGHDVYFTTNQKLVGRDNDETPDIYDARIGGGLASQNPPPPQECLRDDCKATPNAGPELPFGGSEALSGPGNVSGTPARKRCGRGSKARKVKGKTRCLKQHKTKKKAAKRAGSNGRQDK